MTIGTRLFTWWRGELVGSDGAGNRYYRERKRAPLVKGGGMESRERRWVLYKGEPEASKVPPEWHGWLHHITDDLPDPSAARRPWQKPHLPNQTGTAHAYRPPGSLLAGGHRSPAAGDYEAWTP
ncbi:MAG TPA: NADH:ubiquinone oxidoreductase subunit NDUFA12 [Stellaceae bacterium]|nr:NADH:ubiquinone oxidoreductase subunit NDUFA12 [Stellaceae bacterium]